MFSTARTRTRLIAALGTVVLAAGCGRPRSSARVFPKAPVVLISIDTLRSDRLPFYGYAGVKTPALSALRDDSILFESAWSHAPLTLPSHATVFTGLLPAQNGLHDNLGYSLNPSVPTIAELLGKAGYATGGAVTSIVLSGTTGIGRGFGLWDDDVVPTRAFQALSRVQRSGDEAEASMERWIEKQSGPFLAFLHLYEPHAPYEPKEPFRSLYASPYDGEIATVDAITGKFLDFLKAKGLYDRSLIVLMSDHGEGLGDHGEAEHGVFLYREVLQVPLLVKLPKGDAPAPRSVAAPVQLSDLFTTIGKAVGLEGFAPPAGTVSVIDLADTAPQPARRIYAESFFPRTHFGWSELRSLVDGRWHYIEAPRPELFDLVADPAEKSNLADGRPEPFRKLRIEMEALRTSFAAPAAADHETAKKLASLGYLSSGQAAGSGPLDDPKDHIATVGLMKEALREFVEGSAAKSVAITQKLLAENPRMLDIWELQSQALAKQGKTDEALASLRKTIELAPPGSTQYVVSFANHALQMGKAEEARKHAELARSMGDPAGDEILARACLALGDLPAAEAAARECLKSDRNRDKGLLVLAQVEARRGNLPKALEASNRVQEGVVHALPLAGLHLLRGDVLARMGRPKEAEAEFREELRAYPTTLKAWSSLVILYATQNRTADARKAIEEMVAAAPGVDAYLAAYQTLSVLGDRAGAERWKQEGLKKYPGDARFNRPARPA
ncbi:MAG TPA: sulfatase-like hydrolase/transferase [Thermoanaerobaculia bacterium]|nr:sulfatase-like hydrolase/transferase [Thermoanaerobaculia bacterium]